MLKFRCPKIYVFLLLILSVFLFSSEVFSASLDITVTWDPSCGCNDLSFDLKGFDDIKSTDDAKAYFKIFRTFGYTGGWTEIDSTYDTTYPDYSGYGTWSYFASAWDDQDTPGTGDDTHVATSTIKSSRFIHSMKRGDANGEQLSRGQKWFFEYKLQADAYINIAILEPETPLTPDSSGFWKRPATGIVKTILDVDDEYSGANRSFEMAESNWWNEDVWDCRNSSGAVVRSGVYQILFEAYNPLDHTEKRDAWLGTIPYDLRIMDLSAEPITENELLAKIKYNLTGDATVKIIICKPGTEFKAATAAGTLDFLGTHEYDYVKGDILPLDPGTKAVDASRLLKYFKFARKAKVEDHIETWAGRDQNGAILDNDLYVFAISGVDGYGNHAVDAYGNDAPLHDTIPIDRTAGEHATDQTSPSVGPFDPEHSSEIEGSISEVSAVISDNAGIDWDKSDITLAGPGGSCPGIKSNDGTSIIFTLTDPAIAIGGYFINVKAVDTSNNETSEVGEFKLVADSVKPTIVSFDPGDGATVNLPITEVSAVLSDNGSIDWIKSEITLTGPGGLVPGLKSYDGTRIIFYPTDPQSYNGTYEIYVKAVDDAGNETKGTSKFTLDVGFEQSVFAWPNPVKGGKITITYSLTGSYKASLKIYDIMGRLIWKDKKNSYGTDYMDWYLENNSNNKIASGVYVYRVEADNGSKVYNATKKVIVIQ